ncbi:hypothetical protein [Bartonella massiliensis]|uniref:hypothetical protein n=1 Tax=Bartonella massiliensis TaxID=929795 RepID=UPI00115871A3|nr:hypothetical protein [Bartonella massiliensis]
MRFRINQYIRIKKMCLEKGVTESAWRTLGIKSMMCDFLGKVSKDRGLVIWHGWHSWHGGHGWHREMSVTRVLRSLFTTIRL